MSLVGIIIFGDEVEAHSPGMDIGFQFYVHPIDWLAIFFAFCRRAPETEEFSDKAVVLIILYGFQILLAELIWFRFYFLVKTLASKSCWVSSRDEIQKPFIYTRP